MSEEVKLFDVEALERELADDVGDFGDDDDDVAVVIAAPSASGDSSDASQAPADPTLTDRARAYVGDCRAQARDVVAAYAEEYVTVMQSPLTLNIVAVLAFLVPAILFDTLEQNMLGKRLAHSASIVGKRVLSRSVVVSVVLLLR
jgi:hypothetical protein